MNDNKRNYIILITLCITLIVFFSLFTIHSFDNLNTIKDLVAKNETTTQQPTDATEPYTIQYYKEGEEFVHKAVAYEIIDSCPNYNGLDQSEKTAYCGIGYTLARLEIKITNYSNKLMNFNSFQTRCYADGEATKMSWYSLNTELGNFDLTSGRSGTLVTYFLVPEDAIYVDFEYTYDLINEEMIKILPEGF